VQPTPDCFICRKHAGEQAAPPGGYLYEAVHFRVCHAPVAMSVPGTLLVESRRHFLDFAAMTPEEATSYGLLLAQLYAAIKRALGAERVYTLVTLEGAAHFHTWLIPRAPDTEARGAAFLAQDHWCTEHEALRAAEALGAELA
jgi:diadenosine tetraphosphate (Ap4A) HIT family hydrolase